jgi:hypothetical protein
MMTYSVADAYEEDRILCNKPEIPGVLWGAVNLDHSKLIGRGNKQHALY